MAQDKVLVEVFNGVSVSGCECSSGSCGSAVCGPVPGLEMATENLRLRLQESHGDAVEVRYIDTTATGLAEFPLVARASAAGYAFPIIAVNGRPVLAGAVDVDEVRKVIAEVTAG